MKMADGIIPPPENIVELLKQGIPPALRPFVQVKTKTIIGGPSVIVIFAYTHSRKELDLLNSRMFKLFIDGWPRQQGKGPWLITAVGDKPFKLSAEMLQAHDCPKMRKKTGTPSQVVAAVLKYLRDSQDQLLDGDPYVSRYSSFQAKLAAFARHLPALQ